MVKKIYKAIEKRQIIRANYDDGGMRYLEPYCYGSSDEKIEYLRCFQVNGFSKSGNTKGWKLLEVKKLSEIKITNDIFLMNRKSYNPDEYVITDVYIKI